MKVWPKNEQMRKLLKHPEGQLFRETGSSDWPDDTFTHRRLQDGDIVTHDPEQAPQSVRAGSMSDTTTSKSSDPLETSKSKK